MKTAAIVAVVFGLDGTLIETESYYRQAFYDVAEAPAKSCRIGSIRQSSASLPRPRADPAPGIRTGLPVDAFIVAHYLTALVQDLSAVPALISGVPKGKLFRRDRGTFIGTGLRSPA